jgi:WD40 repeat protein
LDNATDGFDLHSFDIGGYIKTLPTNLTARQFPRQVVFGENGHVVVGGSNDGTVYVFDRKTGTALDVLRHSSFARTQTVTVSINICGLI